MCFYRGYLQFLCSAVCSVSLGCVWLGGKEWNGKEMDFIQLFGWL